MDLINLKSTIADKKFKSEKNNNSDIAIVGISSKLPMADTPDEFWMSLINKIESVREFPESRKQRIDAYLFKARGKTNVSYQSASYLEDIESFNAEKFGLTPKEAKLMDPRQRLFLDYAGKALEDAGEILENIRGKNIGVYAGISSLGGEDYFDLLKNSNIENLEMSISSNLQSIIPSRLSYVLDLKGPSIAIDTACSSSLVALHTACNAIKNNECTEAIVGSVRLHLVPEGDLGNVGFESPDGHTRAYDESSSGTGLGEGVVVFYLKKLSQAIRDKNYVYTVIKGSAVNQDGNSIGITAPNPGAQASLLEEAWKNAGVHPQDIVYIEGHGTGTKLGDPIEINGIEMAFSKHTLKKQFCAIGSVKNNIGHLYECSGLVSVLKCVLALNHKYMPPTINFDNPNEEIDFPNSPLYVNTELKKWEPKNDKRLCGISSFGFSGTNCHVILEDYDNNREGQGDDIDYFLPLSAHNTEGLVELANSYVSMFDRIKLYKKTDLCASALNNRIKYERKVVIKFKHYDDLFKNLIILSTATTEELLNNCFIEEGKICDSKRLKESNTIDDLYEISQKYKDYLNVPIPAEVETKNKYWYLDIGEKNYSELNVVGKDKNNLSEVEKKLVTIIGEAFDYETVDLDKNFSQLGGDSVLLTKIYDAIKTKLKINDLTIADLYSYPTISKLAVHINQNGKFEVLKQEENAGESKQLKNKYHDIAVVGMSGEFSEAENINDFWEIIENKQGTVREFPLVRQKEIENLVKKAGLDICSVTFEKAGYLKSISDFDNNYFGISDQEATLMDPVQRKMLENVNNTFEDAGYNSERIKGTNTGIFIGYVEEYDYSYKRFITETNPSLNYIAVQGNLSSFLAGRISYSFDLHGPSLVIDTACSSSATALYQAVQSLRNEDCESAIVGSIKIKLLPVCSPESNIGVESPGFSIRAFDDKADGTVEGEAVCSVMLKPLEKAIADGNHIHSVIKGIGINQDGTGMGITAPRAEYQEQVINYALNDATVPIKTIQYIEAHGTGTQLGDLIEFEAIKKAIEKKTNKKQFIGLSSNKTNFGHTFQASGLVSLIKATLAMKKNIIPATINFITPNKLLNFENSPIYINDSTRKWGVTELRRCSFSSFGLSGTNVHAVLEEYKNDIANYFDGSENHMITISAGSKKVLNRIIVNYMGYLDSLEEQFNIESFGYTTLVGRDHMKYRLALVINSKEDFLNKLNILKNSDFTSNDEGIYFGRTKNKNDAIFLDASKAVGNKENLYEIAKKYCNGEIKGWNAEKNKSTISIPLYPYQKNKFWYDFNELSTTKKENTSTINSPKINNKKDILNSDRVPVRQKVKEIYAKVLGVNDFSNKDSFFELGGNSLKATVLASELYETFGKALSLTEILSYTTVTTMSEYLISKIGIEKELFIIPKAPKQEFYDLTINQMDLWISSKKFKENSELNITWGSRMQLIDFDILRKALNYLFKRHSSLRASISEVNGIPKMFFKSKNVFSLRDYMEFDILDQKYVGIEAAQKLIEKEGQHRFKFKGEELVKIKLWKAKNEIVMSFVISHMIADWWSMDVFINELRTVYASYEKDQEPDLKDLEIQYEDFISWNRELSSNDQNYWKENLSPRTKPLTIKADFLRPEVKNQRGKTLETMIKTVSTTKLRNFSKKNNNSIFIILMSAVYSILSNNSGQTDIILGTNASGRERPQQQNQIGYYINILPIRIKNSIDKSYQEIINNVKNTLFNALDHQNYPFISMVGDQNLETSSNRSPFFDVMVQYLNDPVEKNDMGSGTIKEIKVEQNECKYDLIFNFIEHEDFIGLKMEYSDDLYVEQTIVEMVEKLSKTLKEIVEKPNAKFFQLQKNSTGKKIVRRERR